jgi:hypothetical protein
MLEKLLAELAPARLPVFTALHVGQAAVAEFRRLYLEIRGQHTIAGAGGGLRLGGPHGYGGQKGKQQNREP